MGNWRNRPRRRFHRQYTKPKFPPSYHDPEPSLSEFCNDGVPLWEKKFCTLVGSVSWRKIVDSKNFMCYSDNVLKWDDSGAEEAFQNAKKRYWAEMNGLFCNISCPDTDAYIDQINWDPYVDPELIRDLEQVYFSPPDREKDVKEGDENNTVQNLSFAPSEGFNTNPCKVDNPWESNPDIQGNNGLRDLLGWGQLISKVVDSRNSNSNGNNPWENGISQGNEAGEKHSSWGDCGSRDWISGNNLLGYGSRNWNTGNNSWGHSCQNVGSKKDGGWGDLKCNSWGRSRLEEIKKLHDGENSWEPGFEGAPTDEGWGNYGRNTQSWKQWENHNFGLRRKTGSSGGAWHSGSRKREGLHQNTSDHKCSRFQNQNTSGYKSSRFQRDDNHRRKNNKRVTFELD